MFCGHDKERRIERQMSDSSTGGGWHCPKCGARLGEKGGRLYCEPGDMVLAEKVTDRLRATAPMRVAPLPSQPAEQSSHRAAPDVAEWFCPWCGHSASGGLGDSLCAACGQVLEWGYRYALVELHSHRGWPRRLSFGWRLRAKWARLYVWWRWGA